jgi:small conductance mechanosensitive channel
MPDWLTGLLILPAAGVALRLLLILAVAIALRGALRAATAQVERRLAQVTRDPERLSRLNTLTHFGQGVAYSLILLVCGLMALNALGINIAPLLAGAGVAGLALSLGAQTLIKDFIGGTLILAENQFTVGDVIRAGGAEGEVERITLRATYLRDGEGVLHLVPNGDLRLVSNLTADWARAVVDLQVDYRADMTRVLAALNAAAAKTQADAQIKDDLLDEPETAGWMGLKDGAVKVQLMVKTRPGKQWKAARLLRQYALEALGAEGVRVAIPAQEIRQPPIET